MGKKYVFTVGAVLRGDDACGPMLSKMMEQNPIEGWDHIDGEMTPENYIGVIKREKPDKVVLVDAAQMGLEPGEMRLLNRDDVVANYMVTTHSMPLTYLIDEIKSYCGELLFIGIQPAQLEFFAPMTPEVLASVERVYEAVKTEDFSGIQPA